MKNEMKKIGIYSGIFDPIHHGHISFAQKAIQQLGLDKVYFLVEPKPRHKHGQTDIRHRLNMAWLALRDHHDMEVLNIEQPTFSVAETLPWLEEKFKDSKIHLLMGTDLFRRVNSWPGFEKLKDQVTFVVGQRAGESSSDIPIDHQVVSASLAELASSSIRELPQDQMPAAVPETVSQYINSQQLYKD